MKKILILFAILVVGCKGKEPDNTGNQSDTKTDTAVSEDIMPENFLNTEKVEFGVKEANKLAQLPLDCINTQYPNKLGQTLENKEAMGEPKELHPAFYGCFDWHSSVHAHWTLVSLLKQFPDLDKEKEIRETLKKSLSAENIQGEVNYFKREESDTYERTYGWAWLLKLAEELHTWEDPLGQELEKNLQPLTDLMVQNFMTFLPKLNYPIRVGEHENTAFALSLAYDYAQATNNEELKKMISERARDFYLKDNSCPFSWEPSGFDFLSPCLEEVDVMSRVLPKNAFSLWLDDFMPQLKNKDFDVDVGEVSDRTDGKLVHLDGLNFSRAWVFYRLARVYPEELGHLEALANKHVAASFPNLVGDSYEGGHWLGTFAVYALQESKKEK
ncbi:MAG: DUF2891 domain-containing protein [Salegentibacter sp.]